MEIIPLGFIGIFDASWPIIIPSRSIDKVCETGGNFCPAEEEILHFAGTHRRPGASIVGSVSVRIFCDLVLTRLTNVRFAPEHGAWGTGAKTSCGARVLKYGYNILNWHSGGAKVPST